MTTSEMKKTLKQVIDSLESMHERLEYGQEPTGTDQAAFTFYVHNGEADKERVAYDLFTER